jgi:fatty-acyl-CoA synthase
MAEISRSGSHQPPDTTRPLVTVNPALRAREVEYVLSQSSAHGIVLASAYRRADLVETLGQVRDHLPTLRETIPFADWDDLVASGSPTDACPRSGRTMPRRSSTPPAPPASPKAPSSITERSPTTHASARRPCRAPRATCGVNPMPLFHTAGCVLLTLGPVQGQLTHSGGAARIRSGLVLHLIESERGTMFGGVPTMLLALLEHPDFPGRDLSSVRLALSGGATVSPT